MEPWTRLRTRLGELSATAPPPPQGGRFGAALALLGDPGDGDLQIVLTRRRDDLSTHPGQISFPGGRVDPGESAEGAALREAAEECALRPSTAEVLGALPAFYIPPSRYWLQVVAARWRAPHALAPAEAEVAEILMPRLSLLTDPARWRVVHLSARGSSWAWALDGGQVLWGATAVATALLLDGLEPGWSRGARPEDLPADREVRPWEGPAAQLAVRAAAGRRARIPDVPERSGADLPADGLEAPAPDRAGAVAADAVQQLLGAQRRPVVVLAGPGWTGTVGLVVAGRLSAAGVEVSVRLARPERSADGPRAGLLQRLAEVTAVGAGPLPPAALIVDAITGRGLDGPLRPPLLELALSISGSSAPVVSIDLPSGVHPDRGLVGDAVSADVTLALGAPASGLFAAGLLPFVGDLYLVDTDDEPLRDPLVRILPDVPAGGWRE